MQNSQRPRRIAKPFGASAGTGYIRTVPDSGATSGAASYDTGFPPQTFQPIASGGVPPSGQDMNGVLFDLAGNARWAAAGGVAQYDSAYATSIGGYAKYAVLINTASLGDLWMSSVDNNLTDPNGSGSSGWVRLAELVKSSDLSPNNGYRVQGDGFKECWGYITLAPNAVTTVTLPTPHSSWVVPVGSGVFFDNDVGANIGVQGPVGTPPTAFNVFSSADVPIIFNWHTRGV